MGYCDIYINDIDLENQNYIGATNQAYGTSNIPIRYIGTPIAVLWDSTPIFIPKSITKRSSGDTVRIIWFLNEDSKEGMQMKHISK